MSSILTPRLVVDSSGRDRGLFSTVSLTDGEQHCDLRRVKHRMLPGCRWTTARLPDYWLDPGPRWLLLLVVSLGGTEISRAGFLQDGEQDCGIVW